MSPPHSITISITSHQIPKAGHCPCWNSNGSACPLKDYCNRRYQMSSKTPLIRNFFSSCYSRTKKTAPSPHSAISVSETTTVENLATKFTHKQQKCSQPDEMGGKIHIFVCHSSIWSKLNLDIWMVLRIFQF